MNINDKAQKAWQFLADEMRKETERLPGEFTIKEFMEETERGQDAVRGFLESRVEEGSLSKRKIRINGVLTNVYRVMQE